MRTPSTKTLVVLAILSYLAASILIPSWYPAPVPVIGTNGSLMHGPDGKALVHRDLTQFNKEATPGLLCFLCTFLLLCWLLIRLVRFVHGRWNDKKSMGNRLN